MTSVSLVQSMKNVSYTNNGGLTHATSASALVDWFYQSGAMRHQSEEEIWDLWVKAFDSNPQAAMRLLMYNRDVRGGQGERKVARTILRRLALDNTRSQALSDNLHHLPDFGRWDDLLVCLGTDLEDQALGLISNALNEGNALCAKWMPGEKSKREIAGIPGYVAARTIREFMCISKRAYRKMRSRLNEVVETKMCAKKWDEIEFSKVPSQCALRSKGAFHKNCKERYEEYVEALAEGTETVNASTLYPHQLTTEIRESYSDYQGVERQLINAQWATLPNYLEGSDCKFLPVIDVSGSMGGGMASPRPIEVALGLGAYIAERNVGSFQDAFITFSNRPKLQTLEGTDIWEKIHNLDDADWEMNTNIERTFEEILHFAMLNNVPAEEMPEKILIMSDMEFDECARGTAFESIQQQYQNAGYQMPQIVFWNLNARGGNVPVRYNEEGAALISGFSPSILKQLLRTGNVSPLDMVLEVINDERYACITV